MDNLCHTLVGAALAETGLKHRTRYGYATLLIGANLPDVDVLSYVFGGSRSALEFRRGWTHGVLALAILPLVLTALVLLWHRVRRRPDGDGVAVHPGQIALLAAVSLLTHPLLDFMNTYGMRWLMPFANRWYYGDALFIVDPWMWVMLIVGVVLARRVNTRYAAAALAVVGLYIAGMLGASKVEERVIAGSVPGVAGVMVSPVPLNPLRRTVVIDLGDRYRFGTVNWLRRPAFSLGTRDMPKRAQDPKLIQRAAESPVGRSFLRWARFPFFVVDPFGDAVHIIDARYRMSPNGGGFGTVTIPVLTSPRSRTPTRSQ